MDPVTLIFGMMFGVIGFIAFRYGKNTQSAQHMILGLVLMGFTYMVPNPWWTLVIGLLLTGSLFVPKI